jgi:hypothetical protein
MTAREAEQTRRTKARLRIIQHYQQVTHNVSLTCRFFEISANRLTITKGEASSNEQKYSLAGRVAR